ncbi:Polyphosphate kinase [compost metagenome]
MSTDRQYEEKELSWLSFNERVLQEAMDKTVPLIERVRFLGIFSSNQDEFFKVRVSDVKRRILINEVHGGDDEAKVLLRAIQQKVMALGEAFDNTYKELLIALARHNIFLVNENQLSEAIQQWLRVFFKEKVLRHIIPILLNKEVNPVKFLKDEHTYLAVEMKKNGQVIQYALVEVPTDDLPRFFQLPPEGTRRKKQIIILDNVIRFCLDEIFKGFFDYDEIAAYAVKLTRDAEYDLSDQLDLSLVDKMSDGLKQRLTAMPVRFVYEREMPAAMISFLKLKLQISSYDAIMPGGRYHNFKDFIGFPNVGRDYLENPKLPALDCRDFDGFVNAFDAITKQDILLYYPYHKFHHFTELVRQAAFDPAVSAIRINIYRVAKKSRIIHSLIDAANNGKKVTVVVELRARFDEAANIDWANILTDAGVKVVFGVPSLKIHSKLCLITRHENGEAVRYAHIGTGNFNEKTAKIYTDFSLLTRHPDITAEVEGVFEYIEYPYKRYKFNHLLVSPINSRRQLYRLIDNELANAKAGQPSGITLKINNLVDRDLINRLYAAGQAGVPIQMIIRGMCALRPGVPGLSDNIQVISIIDRFLEHPRVMVFHNKGNPQLFISSADWMSRNIDGRIEVGTPIYDERLKQRILDILDLQLSDTCKARVIDADQKNEYVKRGNRRKVRSQVAIYDYLKRIESNNGQ